MAQSFGMIVREGKEEEKKENTKISHEEKF